jgi:hypothetical protein
MSELETLSVSPTPAASQNVILYNHSRIFMSQLHIRQVCREPDLLGLWRKRQCTYPVSEALTAVKTNTENISDWQVPQLEVNIII